MFLLFNLSTWQDVVTVSLQKQQQKTAKLKRCYLGKWCISELGIHQKQICTDLSPSGWTEGSASICIKWHALQLYCFQNGRIFTTTFSPLTRFYRQSEGQLYAPSQHNIGMDYMCEEKRSDLPIWHRKMISDVMERTRHVDVLYLTF